jgi:ubiquinone/menaquinone biosynthesis C-methylase UbiE
VASAYNLAADHYDHASNSFWERFGRRTIDRLQIPPGARVLDLCCGSGASALPAALAAGPAGTVVGVDLARELIQLGQVKADRLGLTNVSFRVADILELDEPKESFDFVVCVFGIFFVPDMAAALRQMWSFVRDGGTLAATTWGTGLFEPVNSAYWTAVQRVRPELFKSFNPWDLLGEPALVRQLFENAGLPRPNIELEKGFHPIDHDEDVIALLMGSGYRGVIEQLSSAEQSQLREDVLSAVRSSGAASVNADVIYATAIGRR